MTRGSIPHAVRRATASATAVRHESVRMRAASTCTDTRIEKVAVA